MSENTAGHCFAFCSLFESEILLQLILEKWNHPLSSDEGFRQDILEAAAALLETASHEHCSEIFIEGIPANQMNIQTGNGKLADFKARFWQGVRHM